MACGKLASGRSLPFEEFKPGEWKSFKGAVFHPPDAANRPWRVMMLQEIPRPKKGPRWTVIPIEKSGEIEMPAGGHFRCLYNPVLFRPVEDEGMKDVERWEVIRGVRCSADAFRTYSQALFLVGYAPDGRLVKKSGDQAELYLHDQIRGQSYDITILLPPD
jgi:hypothetical protein